jgi:hypothetical protein
MGYLPCHQIFNKNIHIVLFFYIVRNKWGIIII